MLEGRLESYRIQAEEASSTDTKDNKAKLLRQTDVLQSQYAIATENWRGIESSLLARIASIEKERAESKRKENESRRKIREAVNISQSIFKCGKLTNHRASNNVRWRRICSMQTKTLSSCRRL